MLVTAYCFESNTLLEANGGYTTNVTIVTSVYRTGSRSLQINDSVNWDDDTYKAIFVFAEQINYYVQIPLYISGTVNSQARIIWLMDNSNNPALMVRIKAGNVMEIGLGNMAQVLGDVGTLTPNQWHILQIRHIYGQFGMVQVKFNQNITLTYYGDTRVSGISSVSRLKLANVKNFLSLYFDDIIINNSSGSSNNTWMNGARVYRIVPNGAGDYTEWTPSAGNNWDCVDETPPSLSDYVTTTDSGKRDCYSFTDVGGEVDQISGIIVRYWGETVGSPPVNKIKPLARLGTTNKIGTAMELPSTFSYVVSPMETAPDDGSWTLSKVDNTQFGMESSS